MTSTASVLRASSSSSQDVVADLDGLVGFAARVTGPLGEGGAPLLSFGEGVSPPIPSEIILPLAGFLAGAGSMNIVLLIALSTLGAYLGALVLYGLGAGLGLDRS
ncbi:DedA family protein, partial [Frigoribacterium sp. RIT-PI-h]|uniref:DedA family protein n=1 Tax=Frigoribacterium sp. RIT-PI-h TaxID=1690245 RepID=UPI0006CC72EA